MSVKTVYRSGWRIDPLVQELISSVEHDVNIAREVLLAAAAHVIVLHKSGLLEPRVACKLASAVYKLLTDPKMLVESMQGFEDVHEALEDVLYRLVGDAAKYFPLARSRNDHVAAALRLYARRLLTKTYCSVVELIKALLSKAEEHMSTPWPLHTHLQPAQWGTLGHWLASYAEALLDTLDMLKAAYDLVNKSPLGSGPAAGTSVALDRALYAKLLGFKDIVYNTLYATSSRLFLSTSVCMIANLAVELSRLSADLIVFTHPLINALIVPEEFVSTSSAMPHKRNQVLAEIARGYAGKLIGLCASSLAVQHGLPHGYNLDLQEANTILYEASRIHKIIEALARMVNKLSVNKDAVKKLERLVLWSFEAAEQLAVKEGVAFRDAYREVAERVQRGDVVEVLTRLNLYPPSPARITSLRVVVGAARPGDEHLRILKDRLQSAASMCREMTSLEDKVSASLSNALKEVMSQCQ